MSRLAVIGLTLCLLVAAVQAPLAQEPSSRLGQSLAPSFSSEDPTERTVATILREIQQLEQRMLDKVDALALKQADFEERIEGFPTETQQAIAKLDELILERLSTVDSKFDVVDQRFKNIQSRLESLSMAIDISDKNRTENIDIALTAQQDAVAKAADVTAKQIESIAAIQQAEKQVLVTGINGVKDNIADVKDIIGALSDRITAMENRAAGALAQSAASQERLGMWAGLIFGVIAIGFAIFRAVGAQQQVQPQVVYVRDSASNGPSKA